jgi:hypothetical protein
MMPAPLVEFLARPPIFAGLPRERSTPPVVSPRGGRAGRDVVLELLGGGSGTSPS